MMKPIIFVLLYSICSVQAAFESRLIEEGKPFKYVCEKASANWIIHGNPRAAYCRNCLSSHCNLHGDFKGQIKVFCDGTKPIFHFNSTSIDIDLSWIKCPADNHDYIELRVGRYDGRLHSENNSTVALEHSNFTLICNRRRDGDIHWYNEHDERLIGFGADWTKRVSNTKLHIKDITLSDDGKIFACSEGVWKDLSLFRLTVNVPVTYVHIQHPRQILVETEEAIFICIVERSKPEASFEWITVFQNGSSQEIHQDSTTISKTLTAKLWQTNSTLKLKSPSDYQKIMCKATIENLPWTNSEYQSLDIKVPVTSVYIQPQRQVLVEHEEAIFICIVEESKPEAFFEWNIVCHNGSSQGIQQQSTTICKTLKGKLWQTNSTLRLRLRGEYKKIMCKATIENLPWTNSEYQSLDIKDTPISDAKISDTTISTGATIVSCVIAAIIVSIIIIGGFVYYKFKRPSRQEDETNLKYSELMK